VCPAQQSVLLVGGPGSGRTAVARALAAGSGFPLVRFLSPASFLGLDEGQGCALIAEVRHASCILRAPNVFYGIFVSVP
jgi:AAA+ superfamily predicted ATPase